MSKSINFVSDRRKVLTKLEERDKGWFSSATKLVIVVFVIFLVALGARLFFMYQVKMVIDDQKLTRQAILAQEELEKEYTVFAHKLKQLSSIFIRRQNKQETLKFFSELFGDEVTVSEIDYTSDGKEDVLSFTLKSKSIFTLDEIFSKLNSQAVLDKFKNIQKDSLRRLSDGSYGIQITLVLSGETADAGSQ